ncbi:MAG: hypothetical protein RJA36_3376 [Pseudomonadota bacterium]|jgi:carbon monoxide dehydrogenase subunit G
MSMRCRFAVFRLLGSLLLALALPAAAADKAEAYVEEHDVQVVRAESHFTVDMEVRAPVDLATAWAVLTDFEHMASFVGNLSSSQVVERRDNYLRIRQTGKARFGIFSSEFSTEREIFLTPMREIRAHGTGGNVKRMESLMRLEPEEGGVRLRYHAEVEPDFWLPPLLGPSLVRHETAEQFSAMIREMLRRQ